MLITFTITFLPPPPIGCSNITLVGFTNEFWMLFSTTGQSPREMVDIARSVKLNVTQNLRQQGIQPAPTAFAAYFGHKQLSNRREHSAAESHLWALQCAPWCPKWVFCFKCQLNIDFLPMRTRMFSHLPNLRWHFHWLVSTTCNCFLGTQFYDIFFRTYM